MRPLRRLRQCASALLLAIVSAPALCAPQEFDIASGPAAQGITKFAQQAGLPVMFPYQLVQGRRTQALRGSYEIDTGLQKLLEGSGLSAHLNGRGQISIRLDAVPARDAAPVAGDGPTDAQVAAALDELPEISITGTRIQRDDLSTPTPVTTLTRVELDAMGPVTLVDALTQLPQFLNSDTPQTQSFGTSGAAGASYLNLRGIGSVRTLALLDGRRVVPSTRSGTLDIALLPRSLMRRVEVVTGGASAAYGSDAVSGVVNFILDEDFRGFRGHVQGGVSELADNGSVEASATWGTRLGERSSLLLSSEYSKVEGIRGYKDRDWFSSRASVANPDPAGPREIMLDHVHATSYTYGGLITSGPLTGTQFLPGGATAPFETGASRTATTQGGGSGVDPAAELVWILPDQQRLSGFARFSTAPTEATSAFVQLIAARTQNAFDKDPPSLWGPWEATIYRDNAFLPQAIQGRMDAAGVQSFKLGRMGADGDLGRGRTTLTGKLLSATAGAQWQHRGWTLDGYYQYGRDRSVLYYDDILRIDRVYRAVDAVIDSSGRTVCRSTLTFPDDGCVPLSLFGAGSVSPEARAWVTEGNSEQLQDVQEQVAEANLRGDVPLLPAGRMSLAAGASWRLESVDTESRRLPGSLQDLRVEPAATQGYRGLPSAYSGATNIFERAIYVNVAGQYSVRELFAEALVPLLRDKPLAQRLDLHAALRQANYSGSGSVLAWKLGADWQVEPWVSFRATRSRDVRAGNLSERFDVSSSGITIVDNGLASKPSYAVISQREGNQEVEPELADTTTAGIVIHPAGVPNFSVSADYYDIRIHDVIALYGTQNIIDGCAAGDPALCDLIERADTGLITRVHNRILNLAETRSRGIDLELSWRTPVEWFGGAESLAVRLFANRALESATIDATSTRIDRAGQTGLFGGAPRLQANLALAYERGPLQLGLQQRYISSGSYDATFGPEDVADRRVAAASYTTLRLGYRPAPRLTVYLNVHNLFDSPPPESGDWGFGGTLPTNEGLFDVIGRRYVAGLRYER